MNTYLLFKSIHLIAVISWMAGLLYLPRIFVYHAENIENINSSNIFKTMERKLFYYIMTPAMILSWIFGIILVFSLGLEVFNTLWMQIKLISVIFLTVYHFYLGYCVSRFASNQNVNSLKFYRIINEIPTFLLIIIVFVIIYKPI